MTYNPNDSFTDNLMRQFDEIHKKINDKDNEIMRLKQEMQILVEELERERSPKMDER
jgi:peptidoglycan hydrolase CwlO-like protein